MAIASMAQAELCRLRQDIARIEGRPPEAERLLLDSAAPRRAFGPHERRGRLRLGLPALDALLGGGLPLAALHEVRALESREGGAAGGFVAALVARLADVDGAPAVLWISTADVRRETGSLHAPGLARFGIDPARIVEVAARTQVEALWAFEAALSCRRLGVAVCELRGASLGLSMTRRCVLRARETGVTGFLMRLGSHVEASAAELRFRVEPLPAGTVGAYAAGVGRAAWQLTLEKNRGGRTGAFALEWNAHERAFVECGTRRRDAYPQPVPAVASDRPAHPERVGGQFLRRAS